jgi:hypothetical protein
MLEQRASSKTPRYGDEVCVPSRHADGHWTNGHVNAARNGRLVIAAPGHAKASVITAPIGGHGLHWRWPHEVAMPTTAPRRDPEANRGDR